MVVVVFLAVTLWAGIAIGPDLRGNPVSVQFSGGWPRLADQPGSRERHEVWWATPPTSRGSAARSRTIRVTHGRGTTPRARSDPPGVARWVVDREKREGPGHDDLAPATRRDVSRRGGPGGPRPRSWSDGRAGVMPGATPGLSWARHQGGRTDLGHPDRGPTSTKIGGYTHGRPLGRAGREAIMAARSGHHAGP